MHPTRRRRLAALLTVPAACLALAACGDSEEPNAAPPEPDSETASTPAPDPDDNTSASQDDPGPATADVDIDAAKAGLATYLEANRPATPQTSTNIPGCPALDLETAEAALAEVGLSDVSLGGWGTEIEWGEYEDLDPELLGIACGGDSDGSANDSAVGLGLAIAAVDLTDRADVPSFLGTVGLEGAEPFDAPADAVPGERLVTCYPGEGCLTLWSRDDLVIVVGLLGADPTQDQATQLLDAQLPTFLQTLASA